MSSLPESLARFGTELEDAIRRELAAQATARSNVRGARVLRAVRRRPGRTALAFVAIVGAAAAALFVSSPWKSAPGFLEQVHAAITPRAGTVLHVKLVMHRTVPCRVTERPLEMWVDQTPPYKYRVLDILANTDLCKAGTSVEIGGEVKSREVLVFLPPNALAPTRAWANEPTAGPDWVADLRQAIDEGTAHHEGTTVLDGRTVERIRIDPPERFPGSDPIYAYVDPDTFYPVRTVAGQGFSQDFVTYEYLPGTPANRALADIRAQHPNATATELSDDGAREMAEIRAHYTAAAGP